ncbi:hypothetical protein B0J18DRAFT_243358 [Chaetomium sp. MPI-SDFR-AT-0129]|nr:hypothetical protein B0J18DRAFT_243358 [Chaetomium sp. MPI-SDFR-AT-0129]
MQKRKRKNAKKRKRTKTENASRYVVAQLEQDRDLRTIRLVSPFRRCCSCRPPTYAFYATRYGMIVSASTPRRRVGMVGVSSIARCYSGPPGIEGAGCGAIGGHQAKPPPRCFCILTPLVLLLLVFRPGHRDRCCTYACHAGSWCYRVFPSSSFFGFHRNPQRSADRMDRISPLLLAIELFIHRRTRVSCVEPRGCVCWRFVGVIPGT